MNNEGLTPAPLVQGIIAAAFAVSRRVIRIETGVPHTMRINLVLLGVHGKKKVGMRLPGDEIITLKLLSHTHSASESIFLLRSEGQGLPHDYVRLLEEQARRNRLKYLNRIKQEHPGVRW